MLVATPFIENAKAHAGEAKVKVGWQKKNGQKQLTLELCFKVEIKFAILTFSLTV